MVRPAHGPSLPVEPLVDRLVSIYEDAEGKLDRLIAAAANRGAEGTARYFTNQQAQVVNVLRELRRTREPLSRSVVPSAYRTGTAAIDRVLDASQAFSGVHAASEEVLSANLEGHLRYAEEFIGRKTNDVFRQIALQQVALGVAAGLSPQQQARDYEAELRRDGVTAFVDKGGRRWSLSAYARMVTRTTTREAASVGMKNRLIEHGKDLVMVSEHRKSCPICRPFQGKTYSLTGRSRNYPKLDPLPPFHPNCRHVMLPTTATFEQMERALGLGPDRGHEGEIPPPWREGRASPRFHPLRSPLTKEEAWAKEPRVRLLLADQLAARAEALGPGETFRAPEGVLIERQTTMRGWRIDGPTGTYFRSTLVEVGQVAEAEENNARGERYAASIPGNPMNPVPGVDVPPEDPIGDQVGGMLHGGYVTLPHGTVVHRKPGPTGDTFVVTSPSGTQRSFPATSDKEGAVNAAREFETQATGRLTGEGEEEDAPFEPTREAAAAGPLKPLSDTYNDTRVHLHRISEQVLGYAEEPANEIAIVRTDKGFGTPVFKVGNRNYAQYRVEHDELVFEQDGREINREPIPFVDREASERVAEVFDTGHRLLQELRKSNADIERGDSTAHLYDAPIIWPEHFDMAVELGGENSRANYGVSPGDEHHPEPYFYVGPWAQVGHSDLWNAKGFNGAELSYREVLESDDQEKTIRDFYRTHLDALRRVEVEEQRLLDPPIPCGGNIEKAARLLAEGKRVELAQEREVATLVDRLGELVEDAKRRGEAAPIYDLCKVSVKGSNLFCQDTLGIPRIKMPQLKGKAVKGSKADHLNRADVRGETDITPMFRQYLIDRGFKIENRVESAAHLRASQNELNGNKVAGMTEFLNSGGEFDPQEMLVSRDNYIIDGHHRWASGVAHDLEDGKSGDVTMEVEHVDADIGTLLEEARRFAREWGIPQQAVAPYVPIRRHDDDAELRSIDDRDLSFDGAIKSFGQVGMGSEPSGDEEGMTAKYAFTPREARALHYYTSILGYRHLNPMLRADRAQSPGELALVTALDSAFEKLKNHDRADHSPELLYRGIGLSELPDSLREQYLTPGAVIRDPGYSSATDDQSVARMFPLGDQPDKATITIELNGERVADVDEFEGGGEHVFSRGTRFEVVSVEKRPPLKDARGREVAEGRTEIRLRVVAADGDADAGAGLDRPEGDARGGRVHLADRLKVRGTDVTRDPLFTGSFELGGEELGPTTQDDVGLRQRALDKIDSVIALPGDAPTVSVLSGDVHDRDARSFIGPAMGKTVATDPAEAPPAVFIRSIVNTGPEDTAGGDEVEVIENTVVHEIGHYIDRWALGPGGDEWLKMASHIRTDPEVRAVMAAIEDAPSIRKFADLVVTRDNADYKAYFLGDAEMFARSFAQWIALRTGTEQPDLSGMGAVPYVLPEDEFEPIAEAFDRLFESKGLLRAQLDGRDEIDDVEIGVTPYRGAGKTKGADYFETTRYKGFERAVPEEAKAASVEFVSIERGRGVWAGGGEPSTKVRVRGGEQGVHRLMDSLGRRYQQDAVISWRSHPNGPHRRYVSEPVAPSALDKIEDAIAEVNKAVVADDRIQGATVTPDGRVEIIDLARTAGSTRAVIALAERLNLRIRYDEGRGELRFRGDDY